MADKTKSYNGPFHHGLLSRSAGIEPGLYTQLNPGEFRLLCLLPGLDSEPLRARLEVAQFEKHPTYHALSYVWGGLGDTRVIDIGTQHPSIRITASLHIALHELRDPQSTKRIWADQICVNLADPLELNHSVRLIRKVFSEAALVVVYLHPPDQRPSRERNFDYEKDDLVRDLSPRVKPPPDLTRIFSQLNNPNYLSSEGTETLLDGPLAIENTKIRNAHAIGNAQPLATLGLVAGFGSRIEKEMVTREECLQAAAKLTNSSFSAAFGVLALLRDGVPLSFLVDRLSRQKLGNVIQSLGNIALNPAWERLWVMMEITMAERLVFRYGGIQFSPELLISASHNYRQRSQELLSLPGSRDETEISLRIVLDSLFRRSDVSLVLWKASSYHPLRVLENCRFFKCTDPRDKVFAPMCLGQDKFPVSMKEDYSLSVPEVYTECAGLLIEKLEDLSLWQHLSFPSSDDIPSWVPDWSQGSNMSTLRFSRFSASQGRKWQGKVTGMRLEATASPKVWTVGWMGDPWDQSSDDDDTIYLLLLRYRILAGLWNLPIRFPLAWGKALVSFWATLLEDKSPFSNLASQDSQKFSIVFGEGQTWHFLCQALWDLKMLSYLRKEENSTDGASIISSIGRYGITFTGAPQPSKLVELLQSRLLSALRSTLRGKQFFITLDGLFGVGPTTIAAGDDIRIIYGCPVPVCIRRKEDGEVINVGPCYVHDLMFGEGIESTSHLEDVVLQFGRGCVGVRSQPPPRRHTVAFEVPPRLKNTQPDPKTSDQVESSSIFSQDSEGSLLFSSGGMPSRAMSTATSTAPTEISVVASNIDSVLSVFIDSVFQDRLVSKAVESLVCNPDRSEPQLEMQLRAVFKRFASGFKDETLHLDGDPISRVFQGRSQTICSAILRTAVGRAPVQQSLRRHIINWEDALSPYSTESELVYVERPPNGGSEGHPNFSDSNSESEYETADDEATPPDIDVFLFQTLLAESDAFRAFMQDICDLAVPSIDSKMRLLLKWADKKYLSLRQANVLGMLISDLLYFRPTTLETSTATPTVLDRVMNAIEAYTKEEWNWWPLEPPKKPLRAGEIRVRWDVGFGEARWTHLPRTVVRNLKALVKEFAAAAGQSSSRPVGAGAASSDVAGAGVSSGNVPSGQSGGSGRNVQGGGPAPPRSQPRNASQQVAPSTGNGPRVVFFILENGALMPTSSSLRKHDVFSHNKCNHQFFSDLRQAYHKQKGLLWTFLSVYKFDHCDFYQFYMYDTDRYEAQTEGLPNGAHRQSYYFVQQPWRPQIGPREFRDRFWNSPTTCTCVQGTSRVDKTAVDKIPQKKGHRLDRTQLFWGIIAREKKFAYKIYLYSLLCALPTLVFGFWFFFNWIFNWGHSGDLQNAAVPLTLTLTMFGIFYGTVFLT